MQLPALTALVVDDDRVSRRIIQATLLEAGVVPICCSDPHSAMTLLAENLPFDLVVTDYQMPGMNGREFVQKLRGSVEWRETPVIMVSGFISLKEISDLLGNGVDFFMPKPVAVEDLTHYIRICSKRALKKRVSSSIKSMNTQAASQHVN